MQQSAVYVAVYVVQYDAFEHVLQCAIFKDVLQNVRCSTCDVGAGVGSQGCKRIPNSCCRFEHSEEEEGVLWVQRCLQ